MLPTNTLKGFRDYPPSAMLAREALIATARDVYRSFGFAPIDTPALEHLEVLKGKGSDETDKELYHFTDNGGREVGLRFDLTVPFARFAAKHVPELGTPFKRYHIATVWRGEKPQKGRYREFMQCDFDTIGTTSNAADIETLLVIHELLLATGFEDFTVRVNNRKVLTGLLEKIGLSESTTAVLRSLDKLAKIGPEKTIAEMVRTAGATEQQAKDVLEMVTADGDDDAVLQQLEKLLAGNETGEEGVSQLQELLTTAKKAGVPQERVALDISIARGLDYYTGTIYETFLGALPGIGSVCSGGRYDNLTGMFTKQALPGVGASLGLDRLLAAMEELKMLDTRSTPADIFIPFFDKTRLADYHALAATLRQEGFSVEVYPEPKKLGKQLAYADKRGYRVAIVCGSDEFESSTCTVKDLTKGEQASIPTSDVPEKLRTIL